MNNNGAKGGPFRKWLPPLDQRFLGVRFSPFVPFNRFQTSFRLRPSGLIGGGQRGARGGEYRDRLALAEDGALGDVAIVPLPEARGYLALRRDGGNSSPRIYPSRERLNGEIPVFYSAKALTTSTSEAH